MNRLFSKTPKFFKKIQVLGGFFGIIAGVILSKSETETSKKIAEHLATASGVCIAVSQLAKENE